MLQSVLKFEKAICLPEDVSKIVMQLLTVRNRTFSQAEKRKLQTTLNGMKQVITPQHITQTFHQEFTHRCIH